MHLLGQGRQREGRFWFSILPRGDNGEWRKGTYSILVLTGGGGGGDIVEGTLEQGRHKGGGRGEGMHAWTGAATEKGWGRLDCSCNVHLKLNFL